MSKPATPGSRPQSDRGTNQRRVASKLGRDLLDLWHHLLSAPHETVAGAPPVKVPGARAVP
eukprot:7621501-Lingulodinium_polyedra.AAC.1